MSYRNLLAIFVEDAGFDQTIEAAISLARREDAHLEILCAGAGHAALAVSYGDISGAVVIAAMEEAAARSAALAKRAKSRLTQEDIRWNVEDTGPQILGIRDCVAPRARYADLVILSLPMGAGQPPEAENALEAVLFDAHSPVLIVPSGGLPKDGFVRIVIAWDGGDEAMAAVRAGLPILHHAKEVSIGVVDPRRVREEADDPGGAIARYLDRRGIRAEVDVLARMGTVAETLIRHMRDRNADLMILGAYGHARLRERILGGTTHDLLSESQVPLLLAR